MWQERAAALAGGRAKHGRRCWNWPARCRCGPADTAPVLDLAPMQTRARSPLHLLLCERHADWSSGCVTIIGEKNTWHHIAYMHKALSAGRPPGQLPVPVCVQHVAEPVQTGHRRHAPPVQKAGGGSGPWPIAGPLLPWPLAARKRSLWC